MSKEIIGYSVGWNTKQNIGVIKFKIKGGSDERLETSSVTELAALAEILRNEKPVFYDAKVKGIYTKWEPTGEDENS